MVQWQTLPIIRFADDGRPFERCSFPKVMPMKGIATKTAIIVMMIEAAEGRKNEATNDVMGAAKEPIAD